MARRAGASLDDDCAVLGERRPEDGDGASIVWL